MSRAETEQFLQQTLQTIHTLDQTSLQHQIVRDSTSQQAQHAAQQSFAEAAAAVHMDDVNTIMPTGIPSQVPSTTGAPTMIGSPQSRASASFINITPPSGSPQSGHSSSPLASPNPASPMGSRSPGTSPRISLFNNSHPLDPAHLQVDEVSLRASPTSSGARRITPIDALLVAHSPSASPSPPGSPLASPNSVRKRLSKPLNLPSSPRLSSPSPPRSPARHISSPLPVSRSPQSIRQFYFPEGAPPSPTTKKREEDLILQLWAKKDEKAPALADLTESGAALALKDVAASESAGGTTAAAPSAQPGMTLDELFPVTTLVCGFSSYCNSALFEKLLQLQKELQTKKSGGVAPPAPAAGTDQPPRIQLETFVHFHAREIERFDLPTRFFRLLRTPQPPPVDLNAPATTTAAGATGPTVAAGVSPASGPLRKYLTRDDFKPIVQEIVNRHPGLEFLESTPEFQLKYAQTVIARIFYQVNRSGNECLTLRELKNSNFLLMLALLDQEDDINKLNDYFSYEHFYVVYCKFWELDEDHDGYIDANDLIQYDDYALTNKVVERIMAGAGRKLLSPIPNKMNYLDFVIFLISEVDKNNDVSLDYFFNVLDIDGDGVVSTFEIEYFFEEQRQRIQSLSQELITFPDIMCQMIDMVQKPLLLIEAAKQKSLYTATGEPRLKEKKTSTVAAAGSTPGGQGSGSQGGHPLGGVGSAPSSSLAGVVPSPTLQPPLFHSHHKPFHSTATHTPVQGGAVYNVAEGLFYKKDLRESKMAAQFFATLFNLNKFVLSEQRDPIRIRQIHDTPQLSDWDRYAISGYYRLAELPEAADAAAAWADMSDGGPEDQAAYDHEHTSMDVDTGKK